MQQLRDAPLIATSDPHVWLHQTLDCLWQVTYHAAGRTDHGESWTLGSVLRLGGRSPAEDRGKFVAEHRGPKHDTLEEAIAEVVSTARADGEIPEEDA